MFVLIRNLVVFPLVFLLVKNSSAAEGKKAPLVKTSDFYLAADLFDIKNPSNKLFLFEKSSTKKADTEEVTRRFTDSSGDLAVEEKLTYQAGILKKFELDQRQTKQSGFVEINGNQLSFSYTKEGKTKTTEEKLDGTLVSTDEIYEFINKNWEKLMAGESFPIRLPVLDRLETVGFKFFKEKGVEVDGMKTIVIKMKPSSFVIAALVDPVLFYFHPTEMRPGGHKLIQVVGRTVPKRKEGEKWKDLDVIMKFKY